MIYLFLSFQEVGTIDSKACIARPYLKFTSGKIDLNLNVDVSFSAESRLQI